MKVIIVATGIALALGVSGCGALDAASAAFNESRGIVQGEGVPHDSFSLEVGQCLNDANSEDIDPEIGVSSVPVVECSEAHDDEVYANVTATDETFPGIDAVDDEAEKLCEAEFAGYVGAEYEDATSLDFSFYAPTGDSWAAGDRGITCVVYGLDENGDPVRTVGSLKDSAGEITPAPENA